MNELEREEDEILEEERRGIISSSEASRLIDKLYRDYHNQARDSADRAYDEEMDRW